MPSHAQMGMHGAFIVRLASRDFPMTDTRHEPNPPRISAAAARIVLIGAPGPLRTLFGPSRRIADSTFGDLTGWQPHVTPAAESLAGAPSAAGERHASTNPASTPDQGVSVMTKGTT